MLISVAHLSLSTEHNNIKDVLILSASRIIVGSVGMHSILADGGYRSYFNKMKDSRNKQRVTWSRTQQIMRKIWFI